MSDVTWGSCVCVHESPRKSRAVEDESSESQDGGVCEETNTPIERLNVSSSSSVVSQSNVSNVTRVTRSDVTLTLLSPRWFA